MNYLFTYSGEWEGFKKFQKLNRLLKFLQKIPDWELPKTATIKKEKDIYFVGQYYKRKNGNIAIRF